MEGFGLFKSQAQVSDIWPSVYAYKRDWKDAVVRIWAATKKKKGERAACVCGDQLCEKVEQLCEGLSIAVYVCVDMRV